MSTEYYSARYLDVLRLGEGFNDRFDEMSVQEDGYGAGLLKRMGQAFLSQSVVGGYDRHTLRNAT